MLPGAGLVQKELLLGPLITVMSYDAVLDETLAGGGSGLVRMQLATGRYNANFNYCSSNAQEPNLPPEHVHEMAEEIYPLRCWPTCTPTQARADPGV